MISPPDMPKLLDLLISLVTIVKSLSLQLSIQELNQQLQDNGLINSAQCLDSFKLLMKSILLDLSLSSYLIGEVYANTSLIKIFQSLKMVGPINTLEVLILKDRTSSSSQLQRTHGNTAAWEKFTTQSFKDIWKPGMLTVKTAHIALTLELLMTKPILKISKMEEKQLKLK